MEKPNYQTGICDLCKHDITFVESGYTEPYHSWEKVSLSYEYDWYGGPLAGRGFWIDYEICKECFFNKILPKLYEIGLPKKEPSGWIS